MAEPDNSGDNLLIRSHRRRPAQSRRYGGGMTLPLSRKNFSYWASAAGPSAAGDDLDGDLDAHVVVELDGNDMGAHPLDGLRQADPVPVALGAQLGVYGVGHVGGRHRSEQTTFGRGPGRHRDG